MNDVGPVRVEGAREGLVEAYAARIREALEALDDDQPRARAHPGASPGAYRVPHLVGSTRGQHTRRCRCREP